MATIKLYLDTRATVPGIPAPIKLALCLKQSTTTHSTGIKVLPEQWDKATCKIIRHPQKQYLNTVLSSRKNEWDIALLKLIESGVAKKCHSVAELKKEILKTIDPESVKEEEGIFYSRFVRFAETRYTEGNRTAYRQTLKKMISFDSRLKSRTFEEIDKHWLQDFERFMERTSKSANGRAMYFRNIRAVFNDAIDDEITTSYPFRKFKIRKEPTRKRSLSIEQLRTLLNYECEDWQVQYRDMFFLMFYLIGVNAVDLLNAKPEALRNGRLEYVRAKTHKAYSIKVEPEAMALINKYRGQKYLLNVMDTHSNYKDYLHRMGYALKQIGPCERHGLGGKKTRHPLFPDLSQYWCRHTWATIAAELDIPKETIAAGLGHELGNSTTAIYINFNMKKVDEANRRIIDYVLNGAGEHSPASIRQ